MPPNTASRPHSHWASSSAAYWEQLASTYGTPFYLYDAGVVIRQVDAIKAAMQGHAKVYYAVKANPNLGLMRAVVSTVDGVDISSGGELRQALLAGFAPEAMSFAGPAKTEEELHAAIAAGVGCISLESPEEFATCVKVAARLGTRARILIRVNPLQTPRAYGLKMGGRAVQFGFDEEDLGRLVPELLGAADHVDFRGIHTYVGSQCFDEQAVVDNTMNSFRIADELEQATGLRCAKINLGGGFGISPGEERRELNLDALGRALSPLLGERRLKAPQCELIFELGRYLTAEAGVYVTRVINTKKSREKSFAVCDGGLNHNLAAAGTFGAALRGNFAIRNLSRPGATEQITNIAGPSCNPTDLLGVDVKVGQPQSGDLLGILMSGSYSLTASPILFLGRATPVELVRLNDQVSVGRRSFSIEDFN